MSDGFIKLSRSIVEWEWIDDPNTLRLWIQLLCTVNWRTSRYRGKEIRAGQRIVSLNQLVEELPGMSKDMIRTAKQHLLTTGEITSEATRYGDLITVVNWSKYQVRPEANPTANPTLRPTANPTVRKGVATVGNTESSERPKEANPTANPTEIPHNFPQKSHSHNEEEREEVKNNYYLGAHAHAPATTKEEKPKEDKRAFDVNDGMEVRPGIWFPSVRPVTPEEKRANALKCREVFRAYRAKLEGGHDA